MGHRTVCTGGAGIAALKSVLRGSRMWFYFGGKRKAGMRRVRPGNIHEAGWQHKEL